MGNVSILNGDHMEAWDMSFATLWPAKDKDNKATYVGIEELQNALAQGFEPFAVSIVNQDMPSTLVSGPTKIFGDRVWFRKKKLVLVAPVDATPKKA